MSRHRILTVVHRVNGGKEFRRWLLPGRGTVLVLERDGGAP